MAKFSPLNRGGSVPASGKAGTAAAATWLGKLGQAALGTGRMKMGLLMQQQRFNQRKDLFHADNAEWDRRRGEEHKTYKEKLGTAQSIMKDDPSVTSVTPEGGMNRAAPARPANPKTNGAPRARKAPQGPTQQIIALRKAHEAGDGQMMSHKQAMTHRGYATAFNTHVAAGGTEKNFLDNYTPMGYKSRRQNPGDNRNDNFDGGNK